MSDGNSGGGNVVTNNISNTTDSKNNNKLCSKHPDVTSSVYCKECKRYMCTACLNYHNELFGKDHEKSITSPEHTKDSIMHNNRRKCDLHTEYPLDTICNDCNTLCCAICKWEGVHKGHNTTPLCESQEALKESLESYIPILGKYQKNLEKMPQKAKKLLDGSVEKMKETAELIHQQFTIIREAIDKKEEEVMKYLEKNEDKHDATGKLIHNAQELLSEIPSILENVNTLLDEWDDKKITVDTAGEVLSIKKKVLEGKRIIIKLNTFNNCETVVNSDNFLRGMKRGLDEINSVQEIPMKRMLCSVPTGLVTKDTSSSFVTLQWDKNKYVNEYIISMREKGGEWSNGGGLIHLNKDENHYVVYPLKPGTTYEFCIMGKQNDLYTRWSKVLSVKTGQRLVMPYIEDTINRLRRNINNAILCIKPLNDVRTLALEDEQNKALGEAGAIEIIINVMKIHANNVSVCERGCETLMNITNNEQNQIIAGKLDVIDLVLNIIKSHNNNNNVCEYGCGTLWNMVLNG